MLLHTAAYALLHALRQCLVAAGHARLTLETLPLWLLKIGGLVREFATGAYLRLASSRSGEPCWRLLVAHQGRS